jgi:hypothetical protein
MPSDLLSPPGSSSTPGASAAGSAAAAGPGAGGRVGPLAVLFVAALGLFLASTPARNLDLWGRLAAGRELAAGAVGSATPTWLYDLAGYAAYRVGGGAALVGAKALAVAAAAVVMLVAARTGRGWGLPVACVTLAVLAMGTRLPLLPATASCLFLALTVWLLREDHGPAPPAGVWPGWRLAVLFVVWANVDRWFLFGLGAVALTWIGRSLDGRGPGLAVRLGSVAVLAGVCLLNPAHVGAFAPLGEVVPAVREAFAPADPSRPRAVISPFDRVYLSVFRQVPAGLAFYPLLALGLLSFVAARRAWRWDRFLPWAGLAAAASVQAQVVPLFAVLAGPVLAWNLRDVFAGRAARPPRRATRVLAGAVVGLAAVAVLAAAWPGWLQRPPFEPRRWAVEEPAGLKRAAELVGRWRADGVWPAGTRTLHVRGDGVTSDTADVFAWFAPDDPRLADPVTTEHLVTTDDPGERLRAAGVGRAVVWAGERGMPERVLARLLADPGNWPLLSVDGGVAVFGWRDPTRPGDPYRGRVVDFDRLAFRPADGEAAPAERAVRPGDRRWWQAFVTPAPPRHPGRDEAALLLRQAEALRRAAPARKFVGWTAAEAAGLVAAAGGWAGPNGLADAAVRLALVRPPVEAEGPGGEPPPIGLAGLGLRQGFELSRDDIPPAVLYAAVRAARRAVSADPTDAAAFLSLGEAYLGLLVQTRERVWAARLPQLGRLREVQALTAFARAAALNPELPLAHRELARLYQLPAFGCLDLAADHLRAYRDLAARAGRLTPELREALDRELAGLDERVARQTREWEAESARTSVAIRAENAYRRGLGGKALGILLGSDIAAFGDEGARLQLDLWLRTGQPDEIVDKVGPDLRPLLGPLNYHWLRAQALVAAGEYAAADAELVELADLEGGTPPVPEVAAVVASFVGQRALNARPGGLGAAGAVVRELTRTAFESQLAQVDQALAHQGDTATLRGLVALEAGDVAAARAAFRSALAFTDPVAGGLDFAGRPIARAASGWLAEGPGR